MTRPRRPDGSGAPMRGVSMLRRRGSVLIMTLIVMLFLATLCLGLLGFTHGNMMSAAQEQHIIRARVAAQSVLWTVGSQLEARLKNNETDPLGIADGASLTGTFHDPNEGVDITLDVSRSASRYRFTCVARYGDGTHAKILLHMSSRIKEGAHEPTVSWQWDVPQPEEA